MDCSTPGSSLHGILQARTLEWVTISYPMGSSQSWDRTQISCIGRRIFLSLCHLESLVIKKNSGGKELVTLMGKKKKGITSLHINCMITKGLKGRCQEMSITLLVIYIFFLLL